jgi:hypothetical protein
MCLANYYNQTEVFIKPLERRWSMSFSTWDPCMIHVRLWIKGYEFGTSLDWREIFEPQPSPTVLDLMTEKQRVTEILVQYS